MTVLKFLPITLDLELYDFDGHVLEFEIVDEADAAVDVSGWEWASQWRKSRSLSDNTAIDLYIDVSDAATGVLRVHFTSAVMATIARRLGQWDIQGRFGMATPGDPETIASGKVTVTQDVTRPA